MNFAKLGAVCALSIFIAACETNYGPAGESGGFSHGGFSETYVNANTVIVSFDANSYTPPNSVREYVMYRCARVTIDHGYNYFVVTSETESPVNVNVHTFNRSTVTTPPRLNDTHYYRTRVDGWDASCSAAHSRTANQHGSVAVIKMFNGRVPPGMPRAYDALDVIAHSQPATF